MTSTKTTSSLSAAGVRDARRTVYRANRRELTADLRDFLQAHVFATFATRSADGRLHVVPVNYLFEDGRFYIATSATSLKARNAAARRRHVTVTVDDRDTITWVSAAGTAEVLTGDAAQDVNRRLHLRAWGAEALDVVGPFLERTEDVAIAVTPTSWRSWDFRSTVLPAMAGAGIPRAALERLFPS
ncbi:pyridoxamine 5'-phosphate oxidase family protein [Streptomyces sp. TRM64462]|uniref:pyridoxamine 5'-phosphate oxidase family protein n=1 Tax=Streptomyces sp. TRM64462 TaxID=2741726 RepID=UPI001585DAEF|nr:pyridoxamine 5'-phosphate oxidase family protein [Streptomyces sp. TRM64462]